MITFIAILCLGFVCHVSCQAECDADHPCPNFCPNHYHEQCVNKVCTCPDHACKTTSQCPSGHMIGCPPGQASCTDGHCYCNRH